MKPWCAIAAFFALAAPVRAANLTVNPIVVDLSEGSKSALLSVRNDGDRTARIEGSAHAWRQTAAGEPELRPTGELLFFPQAFTLAPGESRSIRIRTMAKPGPVERAYRIIVEELPPDGAVRAGTLLLLQRLSVPVFVRPRELAR